MDLFTACHCKLNSRYFLFENSYLAAGEILSMLGEKLQRVEITTGQQRETFLINGNHALYGRVIARDGRHQRKNNYDTLKICQTIKCSTVAIQAFFTYNNGQYKNFTLGASIGNTEHDMAMFIKKDDTYRFIHFDPNPNVQSIIARKFIAQFSKGSTTRGYNAKKWQLDGDLHILRLERNSGVHPQATQPIRQKRLARILPSNENLSRTQSIKGNSHRKKGKRQRTQT